MTRRVGAWLLGAGLAAACGGGGERGGVPPAVPLRVGVELEVEAERVARGVAPAGLEEVARRRGPGWIALAFRGAGGARSAVRVVTTAGLRVAIDAGPGDPFVDLALGPADPAPDVDGDGRGDVVLEARDVAWRRRCLQVLRVLPSGAVAGVPVVLEGEVGHACLARLLPLAGGVLAFAEAVRRDPAAEGGVRRVELPLVWRDGALRGAEGPAARGATVPGGGARATGDGSDGGREGQGEEGGGDGR